MTFMDQFKKQMEKKPGINTELKYPEYFLHSGNYALNKLMTGNFARGLPQGRLVAFSGHASSGKSLVAASVIASVIKDGGFGFAVDSETSLDEVFMQRCGVDTDNPNYQYLGVDGISDATSTVNTILKMYRDTNETTRGVIVVDSLDMLLTNTEIKRLDEKGDIGGDQGQQAKQLKATLKTWVHSINGLPVTIICTKQPYVEQDQQKALSEPWIFTPSLQFAFSQIIMFEKLVLKKEKEHVGFTLKSRSFKNRFAREKQVVKIEIPYDNGVDPYSGLLEIAEEFGVISKNGGWFNPKSYEGKKFQRGSAETDPEFMEMLLSEIKKVDNPDLSVNAVLDEYVIDADELPTPRKGRAKEKFVEEDED